MWHQQHELPAGGGGVMVWGVFSWHPLIPLHHHLTATVYLSIAPASEYVLYLPLKHHMTAPARIIMPPDLNPTGDRWHVNGREFHIIIYPFDRQINGNAITSTGTYWSIPGISMASIPKACPTYRALDTAERLRVRIYSTCTLITEKNLNMFPCRWEKNWKSLHKEEKCFEWKSRVALKLHQTENKWNTCRQKAFRNASVKYICKSAQCILSEIKLFLPLDFVLIRTIRTLGLTHWKADRRHCLYFFSSNKRRQPLGHHLF